MHNSIFLSKFKDEEIAYLQNKYKDCESYDKDLLEFVTNISAFYDKYQVEVKDSRLERIIYEYWKIIHIYNKSKTLNNNWAQSTYRNFILSSSRLVEFLIYILHIRHEQLLTEMCDVGKDIIIYQHLLKNKKVYEKKYIYIAKKHRVIQIFINYYSSKEDEKLYEDTCYYRSSTKIQASKNEKNHYIYYFKLEDEYILKIYNLETSQNLTDERNPSILFGSRHKFDNLDKEDFYIDNKPKDLENCSTTYKSCHNPRLNKEVANLLEDNVKKEYEKQNSPSKYQTYLIQKQISNALSKNSLSLSSLYYVPEQEMMNSFLRYLSEKNQDQLFLNIIVLGIILQQKIESILSILLNQHKSFEYSIRNKYIEYKIPDDIFANPDINIEGIAYKSESKKEKVKVHLPEFICRIIEQSKKILYEKFREHIDARILLEEDNSLKSVLSKIVDIAYEFNDFRKFEVKLVETIEEKEEIAKLAIVDSFIEKYVKYTQITFSQYVKSYKKKIVCSIVTLPKLSYHYFVNSSRKSAVIIKYLTNKSRNDEVELCYTASKERLYELEEWNKQLIQKLSIDAIYKVDDRDSLEVYNTEKTQWVGSKYFIKEIQFKKFTNILIDCIEQTSERHIKDSLIMMYLRFSFSILFATRDNNFSALFTNFSLKQKLIIKQEKNKNIYTGVRLIPITEKGSLYISLLKNILERYSTDKFHPLLVDRENSVLSITKMSMKNIQEYLEKYFLSVKGIEEAINFVKYTKLNMGRHIFSSYCNTNNALEEKYINAFLNHYHAGNEDQGIYSCFDNQEYQKSVRSVIEEIEKKYFTKYIDKVIEYEINN